MSSERVKLKVGLLVDSFLVPAWAYSMLEKIITSSFASINLVIENSEKNSPEATLKKLINNPDHFFYHLYSKFDEKIFKQKPDAFEIKDAKNLLKGIPRISLAPVKKAEGEYFADSYIEKIREYDIDVFVKLGFGTLKGQLLKLPEYGVWAYQHGDTKRYPEGPTGFWEVFENDPVTSCSLKILAEHPQEESITYQSFSATDWLSVERNLNKLYWESSSFVLRKLKECYSFGSQGFEKDVSDNNLEFYSSPFYNKPSNGKTLLLLLQLLTKFLCVRLKSILFFEQWQLRFAFGNGISKSFREFKEMIPPKDRFWADPHVFYKDNRHYIFIEELEYRDNKGYVSVISLDEHGKFSEPKKIIEQPYHFSYPFIFEWQDGYYIIPESSRNKSIEIYKCKNFPDQWEFHKTIFKNITAVDNTLFFHNKKWWLFTNISDGPGCSTSKELFLFYADNPLSDSWTPHPQNPIVSDSRKARPAGRILVHEGEIYRSSQNCTIPNGYGVNLHKIICLSETRYEETDLGSYNPDWDKKITRIHSLAYDKGLTVLDALTWRPKFW